MRNLILSTSAGYSWDQIKTHNLSAKNRTKADDVCNLFINPDEALIKTCQEHGIDSFGYSIRSNGKPPHNLRFLLQYKFLMQAMASKKYSWHDQVIITDSRDVYFYSDPFGILEDLTYDRLTPIVCGSECINYQDEPWGNGNLAEGFPYVYEEYKTQEICNVGVIGGQIRAVADLCLLIFTMCYHNPASVSDQSAFNIIMGTEFGKENIMKTRPSDGLVVHLGTVGVEKFRNKLIETPSWKDGEIPSVNGKVIPILHQYDRVDTSKWNLQ